MARQVLAKLKNFGLREWLAIILSFGSYFAIAYLFPRTNFTGIFSSFVVAFLAFLYLYRQHKIEKDKLLLLVIIGVLFRLVFVSATPSLSDDYKRFLWDGELTKQGVNPYSHKPSEVELSDNDFNSDWYDLVLSKDYHTVYPPLMQAFFYLASKLPTDLTQIITLRLIILSMEIMSILLLLRLLPLFQLPKKRVLLYALNPLLIIEFAGNLHFEAGLICFTLLAVYLVKRKKHLISGFALSFAFLFKLLPLIFIPGFIKWPFKKRHWLFFLAFIVPAAASTFLIGIPGVLNLVGSLRLYFSTFEFNASIYYIARWIGFQSEGYNIIQDIAPFFTIITVLLLLALAVYEVFKSFPTPFHYFTLALTAYFLLATTINPWYILPILTFGLFTNWTYPVVWSFLVFLSYHAYAGTPIEENTWILLLEYGLLLLAFIFDYLRKGAVQNA